MKPCTCDQHHTPKRIVLTGGPGAGKTAVLELVRQTFCSSVLVLPESAGIVFGGGFPRGPASQLRRAAQRAIYFVQRELEATASVGNPTIVVCDRGTVDGLAYWPGPDDFWGSVATTPQQELHRYDVVIHMRTPSTDLGYNHQNPLRIESDVEAAQIDARIMEAWAKHPRRFVAEAHANFLEKAESVIGILRSELPGCCKHAAI